MNVVLVETSGNQRYIFATNKLRENVGASELTHRIGTKVVLDTVTNLTGREIYDPDLNKLRKNILDKAKNPELSNHSKIEIITATSGKAILLVDDPQLGRQIVRTLTESALRNMPGLTLHGAVSNDFTEISEIHERIKEVHRKLDYLRLAMPVNHRRFQRTPFVAECATSGLPAQAVRPYEKAANVYSGVSITKAENKDEGQKRIRKALQGFDLIEATDMEKCDWTAVIHADGNGLGQIFMNFNDYIEDSTDGRQYVEAYRNFSLALDICTITAARHALEQLRKRRSDERLPDSEKLPVVPLVLGGDDLTVLCDGRYALRFTYDFLARFEEETSKSQDTVGDVIANIAHKAFNVKKLGICAGVAIVKPHYPFHQAYELAEELLRSAKQVKKYVKRKDTNNQYPCSALDYHILYDSTAVGLKEIRKKLGENGGKTHLYARPYILVDSHISEDVHDSRWLSPRKWSELVNRVEAMLAEKDGKRSLPNSQLHSLREALFLGKSEADARTRLIHHRYKEQGFEELLCNKADNRESLFFEYDSEYFTHFIDALDVVNFWR